MLVVKPMKTIFTQSTGAVEYTDCISAEGYDPTSECPGYEITPSDGKASALEIWGMQSSPSLPLLLGRLPKW